MQKYDNSRINQRQENNPPSAWCVRGVADRSDWLMDERTSFTSQRLRWHSFPTLWTIEKEEGR